MKTFCGVCAVLALVILCVDVTTYESLGRIVFHLFLFIANVICANIDE